MARTTESRFHTRHTDGFASRKREAEKWARIWFSKLCHFHNQPFDAQWQFSTQHVIQFLRTKAKDGVPAWQRRKIVENLVTFQRNERVP